MKDQSYYSTNLKSKGASFAEALLKGLAPDGGLYMPVSFPEISREELAKFPDKKYYEIAFTVLNEIIGNEIAGNDLLDLCRDAYYFDVPLEKVLDRKYIMRLDQGPTASFKDFAARMMSRLMQHFLALSKRHLTILTATSGDTGSAVASAFYGLKNINVIILFPAGEVTAMQRKQMTTLEDNIKVIALNGKFDDCQRLVKQAFVDPQLSSLPLSSANSINIGRLLPQSVYYFYAWSRLAANVDEKAFFSVPSGNFGNLMGGLIARQMGLPVEKFIISTNENDEVPEFLRTGIYKSIVPSINCISSAMNVGHPSNLARIVELYGGIMDEAGRIHREPDMKRLQDELFGVSVSDDETKETISSVYRDFGILLEPHGAIAWRGITEYLSSENIHGSDKKLFISLETAHPAKFPEELRRIIETEPPLPDSLAGLGAKAENYATLDNNYDLIREYILNNY
ncbi:MAG: threonine synthase [Bacteroidales bacterium]|nr:threonine synthase [Bacteroidales bacterium]MBK8882491.1 threonine synthase [Bacteroidales bacterium]